MCSSDLGSIHLVLFSAVAASLGFAERMIFLWRGTDWTQGVFVPVYANLDIYICGALAFIIGKQVKIRLDDRILYAASFILFSLLLLVHSRINYLGDIDGRYVIFHEYFMPTVYIIAMTVISIVIRSAGYRYLPVSLQAVRKNPFRLIDAFSLISFQFYLVHSMVLFQLSPYVGGANGFQYNRRLMISGFVISVLLSILFMKATAFGVPAFGTGGKNETAA